MKTISLSRAPLASSIKLAAMFVGLLWGIKLLEVILWLDLRSLAIYPRDSQGLAGILTAPLIHGSLQHLLANSLPTLLLGSIVLYGYPSSRWWTIAIIWLVAGMGVWLFGRESYHLGASGLSHGLFFFLFFISLLRRDFRSIGLMMIAVFLYGGMIWGIFPQKPGISYESHFFGALGGIFSAWLFRHRDPLPERKRYDWEDEDDEQEEPTRY